MMSRETPFAYLHLALFGLVAGLSLAVGGSLFLHDHWQIGGNNTSAAGHITVQGQISEARWRMSAAPRGPTQYLEVRLEGTDQGFLVAERDLSEAQLQALGVAGPREGAIPELSGREGVVRVDSALRDERRPYLAALQVGGRTIASQPNTEPSRPAKSWLLGLLFGIGSLIGVGLAGVSVHHLTVCLRYWRRRA